MNFDYYFHLLFGSKKIKFLLLSYILIFLAVYLAEMYSPFKTVPFYIPVGVLGIATFSSLYFHYFESKSKKLSSYLMVSSIPAVFTLGCFLTYYYYPNLAFPLKMASSLVLAMVLYTLYLVNNIVLVVESRGTQIPLYRVALTWMQVILVVAGIPLIASIFKIPVNPVFQNFAVFLISLLFITYFMWGYKYDEDLKVYRKGEESAIVLIFSFLCLTSSLAVSFIQAETFNRALFVTSVLMGSMGYIQMHIKNSVDKKTIYQYSLVSAFFFIIVLTF